MSTNTIDTAVARQMVTQRKDTAERMKRTHEAAAYDVWFREQVQEAIDDPAPSIAHAEVMDDVQAVIDRARDKKNDRHADPSDT